MSSPASSSDSSSFERLHPEVQQWVWSQGWTSLRDAQEWAVPALVGADRDVIIAASTAAGKTEAAFLPILTNLLNERFLKSPEGILLITPESLEALFVNRGSSLPGAFQNLRYIVIDELHAFIGSERGKQLQSLMQRVEIVVGRAQCENTGHFLEVAFSGEDTLRALHVVGQMDISDVEPILVSVENMIREKWDWVLPRSLLMKSFASSHLDLQAAVLTARLLSEEA